MLAMQPGNQFKHRLSGAAIEVSGRLVGQQNLGLNNEGPGQGNPLLFPTRELARAMMRTLSQSYLLQPVRGLVFQPRCAHPLEAGAGPATFSAAVNSGSR